MKFHAYSEIFPLIEGADFDALVMNIEAHGLREKIVLHNGKILDGRNRFLACQKARVKPIYREFNGNDEEALELVISANIHRRHLTESQRAMAAARIAKLPWGGDRKTDQAANLPLDRSQAEAAEQFKVSQRSVRSARKVVEKGSKELQRAVDSGEIAVSKAAAVIDLPKSEQLRAAKMKPEPLPQPASDPVLAEDWEPAPLTEEELREINEEEDRRLAIQYSDMQRDEVIAKQLEEIKRLNALVATLENSRDGYMNGKAIITKLLQAEQRKVARLEKENKRLRERMEQAA